MIYHAKTHFHHKLMLPQIGGDIVLKYVEQWDSETKMATIIIQQDNKCLVDDGHLVRAVVYLPNAYIVEPVIPPLSHPDLY